MRSLGVRLLKSLAVASIICLSDASSAQPVREATTVQIFPDIEQENGADAICGIRVLFSASESQVDFELYDLTIGMYVSASHKGLTAVRATERKGDLSTDPKLANAARIQPTDMLFGVSPFKSPVGLRDRKTVDGILVATVDESKAARAGDYGGALIRHLLHGEPILVIWNDGSGVPKSFSIRTPNDEIVFEAMQSCLKGSIPLDG
jgi:hypothetical protein